MLFNKNNKTPLGFFNTADIYRIEHLTRPREKSMSRLFTNALINSKVPLMSIDIDQIGTVIVLEKKLKPGPEIIMEKRRITTDDLYSFMDEMSIYVPAIYSICKVLCTFNGTEFIKDWSKLFVYTTHWQTFQSMADSLGLVNDLVEDVKVLKKHQVRMSHIYNDFRRCLMLTTYINKSNPLAYFGRRKAHDFRSFRTRYKKNINYLEEFNCKVLCKYNQDSSAMYFDNNNYNKMLNMLNHNGIQRKNKMFVFENNKTVKEFYMFRTLHKNDNHILEYRKKKKPPGEIMLKIENGQILYATDVIHLSPSTSNGISGSQNIYNQEICFLKYLSNRKNWVFFLSFIFFSFLFSKCYDIYNNDPIEEQFIEPDPPLVVSYGYYEQLQDYNCKLCLFVLMLVLFLIYICTSFCPSYGTSHTR